MQVIMHSRKEERQRGGKLRGRGKLKEPKKY